MVHRHPVAGWNNLIIIIVVVVSLGRNTKLKLFVPTLFFVNTNVSIRLLLFSIIVGIMLL